jgi:hypothetical protein
VATKPRPWPVWANGLRLKAIAEATRADQHLVEAARVLYSNPVKAELEITKARLAIQSAERRLTEAGQGLPKEES